MHHALFRIRLLGFRRTMALVAELYSVADQLLVALPLLKKRISFTLARLQSRYKVKTDFKLVPPDALKHESLGWFFVRRPCDAFLPCYGGYPAKAPSEPCNDIRIVVVGEQVWRCVVVASAVASCYPSPSWPS